MTHVSLIIEINLYISFIIIYIYYVNYVGSLSNKNFLNLCYKTNKTFIIFFSKENKRNF